jgi:hypothetical protein
MTDFGDSPFDQAWAEADDAAEADMAVDIWIDDKPCQGIVDVLDVSTELRAGMKVTTLAAQVFITRSTFLSTGAAKDSIVRFNDRRHRVLNVVDMGGAGARLDCEQPNQRANPIPGQ